MSPTLRIACMGAGYVGGPTMAVIAEQCPDISVVVLDISTKQIEAWNSTNYDLPIFEPGLEDIVRKCRGKNLFFSTDLEKELPQADIIFISVNTPTKISGVGAGRAANIKNCELCARTIARLCHTPKIVVEKSTVPVRTAESVQRVLQKSYSAEDKKNDVRHQILSNPEFLAEGTGIEDLRNPSRVLIGGEQTELGQKAIETLASIYARWVPKERILTTNLWSSELSKLVANAFLAQRISSINSVSALCEVSGADVEEVANAVGSDYRIGPHFLKASIGFGGSCFQKDILNLVYLCETFGLNEVAEYWQKVVDINNYQKDRFAKKMVSTMFNTITGKKITLLGFAFKKNTGDTRETAAASVTKSLVEEQAKITVFDPKVKNLDMLEALKYAGCDLSEVDKYVTQESDVYKACENSHALAILTEWDMFKDSQLDYVRIFDSMEKPAFVFDGRNIVNHDKLREIGFEVFAIGKNKTGLLA